MVSVADVEGAQQAWGEGIVAIAAAHTSGGDFGRNWSIAAKVGLNNTGPIW